MGVVFEMSGALKAIHDAFEIVRHGGNVVLFGIPSQPATIDIAESLIFKNLTVTAVNGRQIWETWYDDQVAPRARSRRSPAAHHGRASARALRGGVLAARDGRGVQDRPATERHGIMNTVLKEQIGGELEALREARTYKRFNVLESPQGPVVEMAGRGEVIVLSSNNYLGLAAHPEVVRALEGLERYGAGTASVRFICGTFEAHHELESKLAGFGDGGGAHVRVLLERERGRHPHAHGRDHRDPDGRAQSTRASSTRSASRGRRRRSSTRTRTSMPSGTRSLPPRAGLAS